MEHYHLDRVNDALAYTHGLDQSTIRKYKHGVLDIDLLVQTPIKHSTLEDYMNEIKVKVDLGAGNSHSKIKESILESKVKQNQMSKTNMLDHDEPSEPEF